MRAGSTICGVLLAWMMMPGAGPGAQAPSAAKIAVAHRGASAYAPEHTKAAYELAVAQKADYVEQDLAITRDGAIICLHDVSLERTTDVETRFPDRSSIDAATGVKRWLAADFTLAEIKTLDAGSWFDPRFAGEKVPTWQEAVAIVGGRAGLYPELKAPALYAGRKIDMVGIVAAELKRGGFDRPAPAGTRPRLVLQSFDADALRALATALPDLPRVLLIDPRMKPEWTTEAGLKEARRFATGIGPHKSILLAAPELVAAAHAVGLTVTPYTFRSTDTGRFGDVTAEMSFFLSTLGVDALFTDNPDRFPR
jgi:glycerophosphoryl diester phosphodiesterase